MTKKRRTSVRYRFESGREGGLDLAEVLYREILQDARVDAAPPGEFDARHVAAARKRLRVVAEAAAEVALRRASLPRKKSDDQIDAVYAEPGVTQEVAAEKLQMSDRQLRNRAPKRKKRKP